MEGGKSSSQFQRKNAEAIYICFFIIPDKVLPQVLWGLVMGLAMGG